MSYQSFLNKFFREQKRQISQISYGIEFGPIFSETNVSETFNFWSHIYVTLG